jgi:hypothetical protein
MLVLLLQVVLQDTVCQSCCGGLSACREHMLPEPVIYGADSILLAKSWGRDGKQAVAVLIRLR